jgi:methylated-DNA-[protein]-cysteine S-methyltransferase
MQEEVKRILNNYPVFYQRVWEVTAAIPFGETRSYQWVASKAGNQRASRAVGRAMADNPLPGIIPCHRVINKNGNTGNYFMGSMLKKILIKREHVSGKNTGNERRSKEA